MEVVGADGSDEFERFSTYASSSSLHLVGPLPSILFLNLQPLDLCNSHSPPLSSDPYHLSLKHTHALSQSECRHCRLMLAHLLDFRH